ncbi:DUF2339 domain-containing protein [Devosia oryziradicis]|uniref:DUF2339 domain-containing protein n=1 Tax=Devosia oryziradicis TaxID=2801335 RepID=A0ABX7C0C9_9HYPH|nr:DUF2339 domain-containing protein [Devosia oryziradicis]QQR35501.1 DUF2339 domain-containing protein [Devosia oryziradicis]
MAFGVLLGAFYLIAPVVALILAVGHSGRVARLAAENASLKVRIDNLERRALHPTDPVTTTPPAAVPVDVPEAESVVEPVEPADPPPEQPDHIADEPEPAEPLDGGWAAAATTPAAVASPRPQFDWERFIGVRLPVWLGALALSLAGFFFVRYSIEAGLLTPAFRVFAVLLAAFGFLIAAELVRRRVKLDNGPAIAAALAAAGVATLVATAYLASVIYELVPITAGFIAMAAATAAGIAIALIFGRTVAIVGMLGGYVTPALMPSEQPSSAVLFAYLTAILVGIFFVIQRKGWWNIALVALLGPLVWIAAWASLPGFETDHIWGTAFLFAVSAIVLVAAYPSWSIADRPVSAQGRRGEPTNPGQAVVAAVALSSLGFAAFLVQSGYALPFWQGLLVFGAAAVALAFIWPVAMRYLPLAPLAATAVAMLGWENSEPAATLIIIAAAAIFGLFALDQFRRLQTPLLASGTAAFVALFFYIMALSKTVGWQGALDQPHSWALGALALAAALLALLWRFGPATEDAAVRDRVYAILASAVTAFLSLVVVLELDPLYYPAAAALEVLGLAYVHRRTGVGALRTVAIGLSAIYALLIVGAFNATGSTAAFSFDPAYAFAPSLSDSPWVLLILPGLAFLGAGYLFRRDDADVFADCLDVGGIAVAAIGFLVLGGADAATMRTAHSTIAKIALPELALAAAAIYAGRRWLRRTLYFGGLAVAVATTLAMALSVVLPVYTFWPYQEIAGAPVFNMSLLSLGLPSLALLAIGWFVRQDARLPIARTGIAISIAAVVFLFTLMVLDIRHAFHPLDLQGPTWDAESYTYSIAMLAFGAALLIIGVVIRNLGARALSFVFVLAATIKVFLFDAADLEGLWRVLSFLGMGLSFLAISWLYARFVFGLGRKTPEQPSPAT